MLPIKEAIVDAVEQLSPQERFQERSAAQRVDIPVPPVVEDIASVVLLTQERDRERNAAQVPEPQILEETVEVVLVP